MCFNSKECTSRTASAGTCTCGGAEGGFEIREATLADIPAVAALVQELAAFENLHHECEETPLLLSKHLFGPGAAATALIAHHRQNVAGIAVWYRTFSTFLGRPGAFVEDLYVRPQFRKHGLGRQLLTAVAQQAQRQGCARLEWRTLKWNETALGFYKNLGAEVLAEWTTLRLDASHLFDLPNAVKTAAPCKL
ncbi:MAG: GNAT family N-acetyltransferase [Opitutaceae bacterium]|nr:GNAT family N-acetyltransferase [Opitutaceae bacterium]